MAPDKSASRFCTFPSPPCSRRWADRVSSRQPSPVVDCANAGPARANAPAINTRVIGDLILDSFLVDSGNPGAAAISGALALRVSAGDPANRCGSSYVGAEPSRPRRRFLTSLARFLAPLRALFHFVSSFGCRRSSDAAARRRLPQTEVVDSSSTHDSGRATSSSARRSAATPSQSSAPAASSISAAPAA